MVFQAPSLDAKRRLVRAEKHRREKGTFLYKVHQMPLHFQEELFRIRVTTGYNYTPRQDVSFGTDIKDLKQQDIAEGSSIHSLFKPRKLSGK